MDNKCSNDSNLWYRWDNINKKLHKLLIFMISLLIVTQVAILSPRIRLLLSRIDQLEGKSVTDSQLFIKRGEIEFTAENIDNVKHLNFYINGENIAVKNGKTVKLEAKNNDIIEISGSGFEEMAILRVTSVSDNVTVPEPGKVIYINNNLVLVDRVRIK